jgi:PAS domain S-box-containing protein
MSRGESSSAAFVASVEQMPDPIVLHRNGVFVLVNPAFLALLGYERADQIIGRPLLDVVHPDDRGYVYGQLAMPHGEREGNVTKEHRILRRDGRTIPVEVIMVPVVHQGEVTRLAFVRDLSIRRKLEAQLLAADRMASLGRLAASIGHEINNPLAYALGAIELADRAVREVASRAPAEADRLVPLLATARSGVERIHAIVRNMKALSGGVSDRQTPLDVTRVLDQCAAMADGELRPKARLVKRYEPVPDVLANEAGLGQVFLNLLINAAQAIAEGDPEGNEVALVVRQAPGGDVVVEVRDTGTGIADEARERLFEPFFTTKGGRSGTGLGLSISHHIVTSLGGSLCCEPNVPRGSCFRVTLRASVQPRPASEPVGVDSMPIRPGRVLVVDDEPLLAKVIARWLGRHRVTTAGGAREALALLRSGPSFDVILCDLQMEDLSGMDLHLQLMEEYPALARRTVFMTGGATSARAREFLAMTRWPVLEKPFTRSALERAVSEVLLDV